MQVAVKDQQSSYIPDLFREVHIGKPTLNEDKKAGYLEEKGSLICKNQSKTIESLLPDEKDLFSGVLDDEDFDLFSSSGGMELEEKSELYFHRSNSLTTEELNNDQNSPDYLTFCEKPSRTLLVKNVDNRVEDLELRVLFEQHGDIQSFYTTCRCQGFVIISYYDIRAATIAFSTLQNKLFGNEKLHLYYLNTKDDTSGQYIDQASLEVFSCDSSISNNKLHQIFATFGEIEEISGTTHHRNVKYYDIRAAEAAISGLNSSSILKEIKLEINYPERAKSLMQQSIHRLVQGQLRSGDIPKVNSLPQVINNCMKDEYIYNLRSPNEIAINANCCFTNSYSSPVGITSIFNQFGLMSHYPTNQAKLQNNCPSFRPQSLPNSCRGFVDNGINTYGSLNMPAGSFTTETDDIHLHMVGPYGPPVEHMFTGSPRITRSFQNHHLIPAMWAHSPSFDNGVSAPNTFNIPANHKKEAGIGSVSRSRGRLRRISHGKHDIVSCHTDEKKYELDIDRVLTGEDSRTTLMIKNIPNKYSSAMLLAAIDEHNQGTYDFIYLPLDFKNKCNMGYAFINMTDPLQIVKFHKSINGKKWEKFHSGKVACLAYARIQGKAALIAHFQESSLMNEDKCCHPILFTTDGPNAGNREAFPLSPNNHPRRHKNRCNITTTENQEISYHYI